MRGPPCMMSGDDILAQLEGLRSVKFGKVSGSRKRKRNESELNWTKRSIFFELPYWQYVLHRHNLDVMHIEKNICDNVIGTLLNIKGKTKDNPNSRLDMERMGIRHELHLVPRDGGKFLMPTASYTLHGDEKRNFCEWLKTAKFPDGFASNISSRVNLKDGSISGMKSHDSHVLLQRLIPVVMRRFSTVEVQNALIELGIFFRELCCRKLQVDILEKLQSDIALLLCKLEKFFPPSFFDVMVHLAVHLPREALLAGPVQYRWMYPVER